MLIETTWKVDDICTVKMVSGEEIIAKIVAADDASITMSKPLSVQLSMDPQSGRMGMQLLPGFVLTVNVDTKIKVGMNNVMFIAPTEEGVKNSYLSQTTGLALSSGNSGLKL